ncbi:MAG TPA: HPr(Ser) kinase/phosphatase [Vicinamibacteria bacterium]|nr:HPr(Ser) kinase/phosphatase [Vicinamibacteria bacterium]
MTATSASSSRKARRRRPAVAVAELLAREASALGLRLLAGRKGLRREVLLARVQRPGLALAGHTGYVHYGRVQIIGGSEMGYLRKLKPPLRAQAVARLLRRRLTCLVVTKAMRPPVELVRASEARGIPLLATRLESTAFLKQLTRFLEPRLAASVQRHAVLVDVFGLGVLIAGQSGIGKSECALELVDRGHRLVADDVVVIKRLGNNLVGDAPELTRDHMELRGLGILDVRGLYGVSAMRHSKRIELVVNLERWAPGRQYDRLGLSAETETILGVEVPLVRMPVAPGRNIALLIEVASRSQLLKARGYDAARRLTARVDALVGSGEEPA